MPSRTSAYNNLYRYSQNRNNPTSSIEVKAESKPKPQIDKPTGVGLILKYGGKRYKTVGNWRNCSNCCFDVRSDERCAHPMRWLCNTILNEFWFEEIKTNGKVNYAKVYREA